jgi:uncharacterized protein YukE
MSDNRSNEGIGGSVTYLNTANFNDTLTAYSGYISQFDGIINAVNSATDTMIANWQGDGCKAFEKDSKQVQLNLKDISDIMYDLRDALINAHMEYIKEDLALSKSLES